ncbi:MULTISPECIES: hypothetical protein [Achromobacter]|uniref:Tol-pal system protein YbgF n=1 Tax=Alcaligenes xylosoxydans xylosoxydans TaxID=85698 RepID=A0A424WBM0_ALCXX|nr:MULTISPECIES: hypothetical protein [Achromobacter]MBC9907191.1 hypothetical protein [Achromobacter xylosoxidans]MBD0870396.1 hypothetical protein [Achromobacter xylosoxidans]MDH1300974.1 hypothetical protein [Achromobacter sp. GD03932]QNP85870.1 hypothetical protein IAG39_31035 [Achromobacter xylosoxidans]RPJ90571.1 hypothetical protein DY367_17245 [Achromobacter xylosoxidans]
MGGSVGKFMAACGCASVLALSATPAARADRNNVQLKDFVVERPFSESMLVVGHNGRVSTGMEVDKLTRQLSEQADALTELRRKNEELNRKLEEQAQKLSALERKQGDGGRSSDGQRSDLDKLARSADSQKNELEKLSRSVSQLNSNSDSSSRNIEDLQRRLDDVKRSLDDVRSRVK